MLHWFRQIKNRSCIFSVPCWCCQETRTFLNFSRKIPSEKTRKRSKSTAIPRKSRTTSRPFWKHKNSLNSKRPKTPLINSKSQAKYYYFVRLRKDVSIKAFHRISFFKSKKPYLHFTTSHAIQNNSILLSRNGKIQPLYICLNWKSARSH